MVREASGSYLTVPTSPSLPSSMAAKSLSCQEKKQENLCDTQGFCQTRFAVSLGRIFVIKRCSTGSEKNYTELQDQRDVLLLVCCVTTIIML